MMNLKLRKEKTREVEGKKLTWIPENNSTMQGTVLLLRQINPHTAVVGTG